MRILHVTKKYPNALGGDAIVVQNLEKQQKKNGHEVFILTTNCEDIIDKNNLIKFGLKDTPSNLDRITLRRIFSLIGLYFKSFKILRDIKPDVVHSHSVDMGYVMSFACRKEGIPIINHFHTGLISIKNTDKRRAKLESFFIKHSKFDKIITVNPKDIDSKVYSNAVFIPNAVDLEIFGNNSKSKKDNKKIKLLFVGRVEEAKGLDYLIKAIDKIVDKYLNIKLKIVGKGEDTDHYKSLVNELNLKENIQFEGQKTHKELAQYYSDADIFILPSLDEGFPVSMLEAWVASLSVIITDVGGISKICTNNKDAMIISSKNSEAIKNVLIRLIEDKELRKKLGENGRKLVEEKYTWEKVAKDIENVYRSVLI